MDEQVKSDISEEIISLRDLAGIDAVLLFGSHVGETATESSDYDLCIVASSIHSVSERAELLGNVWRRLDANKYDVWIFEEFPLYLKMNVIKNHEVLFCDDIPELYEYFYQFRKLWRTQEHRQSLDFQVM